MRNVLALGAAILVVGAAGMSFAQERLQTNQSGMGVGEGVGDVSGSSTRVTTFDRTQFLDRLSQAETMLWPCDRSRSSGQENASRGRWKLPR